MGMGMGLKINLLEGKEENRNQKRYCIEIEQSYLLIVTKKQ
jgi:hypothetical protein